MHPPAIGNRFPRTVVAPRIEVVNREASVSHGLHVAVCRRHRGFDLLHRLEEPPFDILRREDPGLSLTPYLLSRELKKQPVPLIGHLVAHARHDLASALVKGFVQQPVLSVWRVLGRKLWVGRRIF